MRHFITIPRTEILPCGSERPTGECNVYLCDTGDERDAARAALRDAGISSAVVRVGEPEEGQSIGTDLRLIASGGMREV